MMGRAEMEKMDIPPVDRWRVDDLLEPERKLWGLTQIAEVLGVSVDKTRELAKSTVVPIYRPAGSGSYFAFRSELMAWLRTKPSHENQRKPTIS